MMPSVFELVLIAHPLASRPGSTLVQLPADGHLRRQQYFSTWLPATNVRDLHQALAVAGICYYSLVAYRLFLHFKFRRLEQNVFFTTSLS